MKNNYQSKAVPRGTRTIWRYLGALFLLFTFAIGNVWAQTSWVRLDSIDFTNTTDFPAQTITGANSAVTTATINGVFFRAKAKKSIKINNTTAGVDFDAQNGDASSHHFGIPVTGVNGSIKVIIYHDYNNTSANFKMGISHATDNDPSGTQTWDLSVGNSGATKNANDWVMTKSGLTGSEYIVWAMEAGSSYKVIKKIAIYTEAPSTSAPAITAPTTDQSASYTVGDAITALSVTATGTPAPTYQWYYNSSASTEGATSLGSGAQTASYTPSNAAESDLYYYCIATNSEGSDQSPYFHVTVSAAVATAPSFTSPASEPAAAEYHVGDVISALEVEAAGYPEPALQWYSNTTKSTSGATLLTGEESASYIPSNAAESDLYYYCVASNASGDAQSEYFHVTVLAALPPCTSLIPATSGDAPAVDDEIVMQAGSNGGTMTVIGLGTGNISYSEKGLGFNSKSGPTVKVVLDHLMQAGSKISLTLEAAGADTRGLTLKTKTGSTISAFTCWVKDINGATNGDVATFTYTVVAGDGIEGTNEFQLARNNSVFLKSLTVSNCGAELFAITTAISPVEAEGKATITLSANPAAAGASVTATASAFDPAWEFDSWQINNATLSDASTNPTTITMGSTDATITLKLKAAAVKYLVTYYDGEESMGTELVLKDGHPTATGIATRKLGYTFQGWSLTNGGAVKALSEISVTDAMPLYAVYAPVVCPTKGTVFSMSVTDAAATEYNENNTFGLEIGATYTLGIAYSGSKNTTKRVGVIDANGEYSFTNNGDVAVKVALDCALAEGDVISFTSTPSRELKIQKVVGTDLYTTSGKKFTIPAESPLIGESEFYLMRGNSGSTFKTITVSRPYTVSFNLNGQSATAIDDQKIIAGGKVTEPTDPVVEGQEFGGWFQNSACTGDAWDFANDVVSGDLELFAKWTALPKMTLKAGEGATGDDIVSYPTVGEPVAVPTCPETFEKSGYIFAGWTYSPSVDVENGQFNMPNEDLTLTAQWEDASYVAQIGEAKYASLEAALEHAADGTIELLQDIDVTAQVEIADGVTATIDLAGHKIEYTGASTLSSGVILVHNGGSLTINDSSDPDAGSVVAGEKAYAALALTKAGDDASKVATLTINGGSFTGTYYAITGHGSRPNTNITINGGTFTATAANDNLAIYHPQNGTLTINGGSFEGYLSAIEMRAGTLVINNGTFTSTATEFVCNPNGGGTTTQGAAIAIAQHTTKKDISVTINGGTFNGVKAINESNPQENDPAPHVAMAISNGTFNGEVTTADVNHFVSGGTFTTPVAEANCATGYVPETKANGKYGVIVPAQDIDFEAIIDAKGTGDEGKAELDAQLTAKHYDIDGEINNDRLDPGTNAEADKGFKVKKTGLTISFSVEAGKVVEITTGSMSGASIKVDAEDAVAMTASHTHTYYSDDAQAFLITMTAASNKYNIFKSIVIRDPYQVAFNANGGEPVASQYAKPSVTLPSAVNGTKSLVGWFDAATGGTKVGDEGDAFTPTKDTTLFAQWEEISTDARLASITLDPSTGVLSPAFDPEVTVYTYTMPYGTAAIPQITGATAVNAGGSYNIVSQADAWGETAIIRGVAASSDTKAYNITMLQGPKDGICLIKATHTGATTADVEGKIGGTYDKFTQGGGKLGSNDHYFGVKLAEGTFQAGDIVKIYASSISTSVEIFSGKSFSSKEDSLAYLNKGTFNGNGIYTYILEDATEWIYLYRTKTAGSAMNPTLGYIAVYRPTAPILQKVTVAGVEAAPVANVVTIEVPASTADAALEAIAFDWISNDDAWTADHAPVVANAWAFGVENTVTFTDKDGDESVYYITISKALPSSDATLSALSYGDPATAIALVDGVFEYNVELPYGTSAVPALAATAHHAGANVTEIADADAFVDRHATSTVTVTAEDGTTTQDYIVNFVVSRYESKLLWDGSTMSALSDITTAATAAGVSVTTTGINVTSFSAKTCEENGKSYTKALDFGGKTQSTRNFGIEIPAGKVAKVSLVYRAKSADNRKIMIATALSNVVDESTITSKEAIDGSNLYIMTADMFGGGTLYINTTDGFHVHEISIQLADGFARSSMLGAGVLGTVCVPNNVAVEDIQGVTVYELMGRDYSNYGKLAFDQIVDGELEAGVPYVFQANRNHMALLYGTTHVDAPEDKGNGMYGTFEQLVLEGDALEGVYYFAERALWSCEGVITLTIPANRAYVKLGEIDPVSSPNPAPGRIRMMMDVHGEEVPAVTTGMDALNASEAPVKVMIDGKLFILRGEQMFDATGRLVK